MHTVTPHLICAGAAEAIEFYKKAFGAVELSRMPGSDGKVMHASIRIGDSVIMLNDEIPEWGSFGAKHFKGSPVTIHLYVENADAAFEQAVRAGRESHDAARRHVLGRSLRQTRRSFRPSMVDRHARPRCQSRGDAKGDGANGLLIR